MSEIWVGRHGRTEFNIRSKTQKELIRGWLNVPLDDQGKEEAVILADYLWDAVDGADKVWASDLDRTVDTAKPIADALQVPVEATMALRPWNLGDLQGSPVDEANFIINRMVMAAQDEPAPNGESFNDFKKRVLSFFDERLKEAESNEGDQILITHYRDVKLIQGYLDGQLKKVSIPSFLSYSVEKTGELMRVFKASGNWTYQMVPLRPTTMEHSFPDETNQ